MLQYVIIITGANNGIGLGLARSLDSVGHRVAALDLSTENLDGIDSFVCDVTDPEQVKATIKQIIEKWGRVDVLVNNACLTRFSPFEVKKPEEIRCELEVNYFGYVNMIRAVLPQMKKQGSGIIHNVSSTVGTSGFEGLSGYGSAKGAIESLTRTLAIEFEKYGISVNLIHLPLTRTKSSSPLGIPQNFMADAEKVGQKLALKIGSRKGVITTGLMETFGVFAARIFPSAMGRFMSKKAAEARKS